MSLYYPYVLYGILVLIGIMEKKMETCEDPQSSGEVVELAAKAAGLGGPQSWQLVTVVVIVVIVKVIVTILVLVVIIATTASFLAQAELNPTLQGSTQGFLLL